MRPETLLLIALALFTALLFAHAHAQPMAVYSAYPDAYQSYGIRDHLTDNEVSDMQHAAGTVEMISNSGSVK